MTRTQVAHPSIPDPDGHARAVLEFDKLLEQVASGAQSPGGRERVLALLPTTDADWIQQRHRQVASIQATLEDGGLSWPLSGIRNIKTALVEAARPGARLDGTSLRDIAASLEVCAHLRRFLDEHLERLGPIVDLAEPLGTHRGVVQAIHKAVSESGEILDLASPRLRQIRRRMQEQRTTLLQRLEKMMGEARSPDDYVTLRGERYVIPVRGDASGKIKGIVHDRSGSKATLFVEPFEVVEANNELQGLRDAESSEIHRILQELTTAVAEESHAIAASLQVLEAVDCLHAVARFGQRVGAAAPALGARLRLRQARHPLLVLQWRDSERQVVPLDVALDDIRALVITGPNTGGKTVALKVVGLLVLMHQAGIPLPAQASSTLPVFDHVVAGIGDEQSIEASESTFSSHLRHVARALEHATAQSLILLDEFMSGTDPEEGAALAKVVLRQLVQRGATVLVTTHLGALKLFAHAEEHIANAAMLFDSDAHVPTYRLQEGVPGSSNALEIAAHYGVSRQILEAAEKERGKVVGQLEKALEALQQERAAFEKLRRRAQEAEAEALRIREEHAVGLNELHKKRKGFEKQAKLEASELVRKAQARIEQVVRELRQSQAGREQIRAAHATLDELRRSTRGGTEPAREPADGRRPEIGDRVRVKSLGREGILEEWSGTRARIRFGNATLNARLSDLERLSAAPAPEKPASPGSIELPQDTDAALRLDVRGLYGEEAVRAVDQFLDRLVLQGRQRAEIVHGKGTGALRQRIAAHLAKHAQVAEYRLGNHSEGGAGVTIVTLR